MTNVSKEAAEAIAIQGLAFLAQEDDLLMRFSGLTGILPNDMRSAAGDPGFLVGVLDFFLAHEPDLLAFTESASVEPDQVIRARMALAPNDVSGFE